MVRRPATWSWSCVTLAGAWLSLTGCFNPSYEQAKCSPLGECPSGLTCVAEVCVAGGALPDGGVDGSGDASDASVDARPASTIRSCVGQAPICGPNGDEDCCTSLEVPGGSYFRGYDLSGEAQFSSRAFPATVSSFRLDKYEITVGRFRQFVLAGQGTQASPPAAGDGAHPLIANSGWDPAWNVNLSVDQAALIQAIKGGGTQSTWTDAVVGNEARPMNAISWFDAMAFCAWDGGYLPTEAEWNYAGTGGNQQRAYPWSSPPGALVLDPSYASYQGADNSCMGDGVPACTVEDYVRVGSKPAGNGRWGHADLAGNVFEWIFDSSYPPVCIDCGQRPTGTSFGPLIRGGAATFSVSALRPGYRVSTGSTAHAAIFGARCARPATP